MGLLKQGLRNGSRNRCEVIFAILFLLRVLRIFRRTFFCIKQIIFRKVSICLANVEGKDYLCELTIVGYSICAVLQVVAKHCQYLEAYRVMVSFVLSI